MWQLQHYYTSEMKQCVFMLQEVVADSLRVLTVNAFLDCITAMASLTVTMAVMNNIAVRVSLLYHCAYNFISFIEKTKGQLAANII